MILNYFDRNRIRFHENLVQRRTLSVTSPGSPDPRHLSFADVRFPSGDLHETKTQHKTKTQRETKTEDASSSVSIDATAAASAVGAVGASAAASAVGGVGASAAASAVRAIAASAAAAATDDDDDDDDAFKTFDDIPGYIHIFRQRVRSQNKGWDCNLATFEMTQT